MEHNKTSDQVCIGTEIVFLLSGIYPETRTCTVGKTAYKGDLKCIFETVGFDNVISPFVTKEEFSGKKIAFYLNKHHPTPSRPYFMEELAKRETLTRQAKGSPR